MPKAKKVKKNCGFFVKIGWAIDSTRAAIKSKKD